MARWRRKRGGWYRTGVQFDEQMQKTITLTEIIRKINEADDKMTVEERRNYKVESQSELIKSLAGLPAWELEALLFISRRGNGPLLHESIRAIISQHRATNRSDKDRHN